jgi:hypothetical protein
LRGWHRQQAAVEFILAQLLAQSECQMKNWTYRVLLKIEKNIYRLKSSTAVVGLMTLNNGSNMT